jgi:hypothetical protein
MSSDKHTSLNNQKGSEKVEDRIKKLTKLITQLSKLALKVIELLTYLTVAELTIKTMIDLW